MENLTINNVRVAWNEAKHPELLNGRMSVYKMVFPDNSYYIGYTTRSMLDVLNDTCNYYMAKVNKVSEKIKHYRSFFIDVLYKGKSKEDVITHKQSAILSASMKTPHTYQLKSFLRLKNKQKETTVGELLNEC